MGKCDQCKNVTDELYQVIIHQNVYLDHKRLPMDRIGEWMLCKICLQRYYPRVRKVKQISWEKFGKIILKGWINELIEEQMKGKVSWGDIDRKALEKTAISMDVFSTINRYMKKCKPSMPFIFLAILFNRLSEIFERFSIKPFECMMKMRRWMMSNKEKIKNIFYARTKETIKGLIKIT